jgi:PRTRC genetic system ThiF family protein
MKPIKTHRLEIGAPRRVTIILAGCGGTGSYAALHLAQLAYAAHGHEIEIKLVFVDPDHVERKNVARQNFAPGEVGQPKAVTLARRYSLALGLAITPIAGRFERAILNSHKQHTGWAEDGLTIIAGCVDNTAARQDIRAAVLPNSQDGHSWRKDLFWIDAGNHYAHGQVLLGNSTHPRPLLSPLGFAYGLPLPSVQEPALVAPEAQEAGPALSCADLVERDVQARTINKMMAAWIDVFCERLIISRDLRMMGVRLDQRSGAAAGIPITGGVVVDPAKGKISLQDSYPAGYPANEDEDDEGYDELTGPMCSECGADLVRGRDIINDEETEIYFCLNCEWRMTAEEFEEMQAGEALGRLMQ